MVLDHTRCPTAGLFGKDKFERVITGINRLNYTNLQKMCKAKGIRSEGSKTELKENLTVAFTRETDALLSQWPSSW